MNVHFGLPAERLGPSWVTIGSFDGVHRGHAEVVRRLTRQARTGSCDTVVVTFDPHPRCVLAPDACPPMLTTVEEKAEIVGTMGVDHLVVLPFTRRTSQLTPSQFIDQLLRKIPAHGFVIGYDFAFGHKRRGNRDFLAGYGARHGFEVDVVQAHSRSGRIISSSAIRALLLEGKVGPARALLGRDYWITSFVEAGTQTGSRIGFPTANFAIPPNKLVPQNGIYAVWVDLKGKTYRAAMSIGYRPTFGDNRLTVEAFILDFKEDIYHETIRARFVRRIRDERKFPGVEPLVAQIEKDVARTRSILREP